jgi:hypothetical protein
METLKNLFTETKQRTGIDHTEWIETNRGDLRLFAPTDWLSGEQGEIQAETEQGEILNLSELSEDEIEMFISLLTEPKYICTNCGGGFNRIDMVLDEDDENDFCKDCSK